MWARLVARSFMLLFGLSFSGCSDRGDCTMKGCVSGVGMSGEVTNPLTELVIVEVCFNGGCANNSWNPVQAPNACTQVTADWGSADLCPFDEGENTFHVAGFIRLDPTTVKNGDHVAVYVSEGTGTALGLAEADVTYSDNYPNGPECDGDPCKLTTVTLTPQ